MNASMKLLALLSIAFSLFLVGCESTDGSLGGGFRERWKARSAGQNCVYEADAKTVHAAAVAAAKAMGFRVTKSGAAQGILEAVNGIRSDSSLRSSRQILMKVRIGYAPEGSEVKLFLTEILEDDYDKGRGMGTEVPLESSPLYEVFFRHVAGNLKGATPAMKVQ